MKRLFIFLLSIALLSSTCAILTSCDNDDDEIFLTYKIDCNNPIAHVEIWPDVYPNPIFIGHWEYSEKTNADHTQLDITCIDDPLATITCRVYINGKLVQKREGLHRLKIDQDLRL